MFLQHTVGRREDAIGIGVHSGQLVRISIRPAPADTGIVFVRSDCPNNTVPASALHVSDTALSTSIAFNDVEVGTIEHLMSALWGMNIDNAYIILSGKEVPILDGSSRQFVDLIESAGLMSCNAPRQFIRITKELTVTLGDSFATLRPYDGFKASYTFEADHAVYNQYPKYIEIDFAKNSYKDAVSSARTFGLIKELPGAIAVNRCLGSSLQNAVGIDDDCILNPEGLRFEDEFVRHKVLDAIGDLYLLGKPMYGEFIGYKSGHTINNKLVRTLLRCPDFWEIDTPIESSQIRSGEADNAYYYRRTNGEEINGNTFSTTGPASPN